MRRALVVSILVAACTRAEPGAAPTSSKPAPIAAPSASATTAGAPERLFERLYHPPTGVLFQKKLPPRPGDWLARFREPGQSFLRYQSEDPVRPTQERKRLIIQPLGRFGEAELGLVELLRGFMSDFFMLPVETRSPLPLPQKGRRTCSDGATRFTQHYTKVLLEEVLEPRLPADAIVYLGVTLEDLYPDPDWNFVFGQATLEKRVGVYSLARFFPSLTAGTGLDREAEARRRGIARSAALLAHETGHAFGMHHCTEYECVMNGSNSLDELDRQFGELCPVCLRKLAWNIGFDPRARYQKLETFYRREGVDELTRFLEQRLTQLEHGPP